MTEPNVDALLAAVNGGDLGAVIDAVDAGGDVNGISAEGFSPLMVAAYRGQRDIAEYLLGMGADANLPNDKGALPMHYAAAGGSVEMAELLFLNGAQLDAPVYEDLSWTELHVASFCGNEEVFEFLVGCGANHKIKDADGFSPQEVAQSREMSLSIEKKIGLLLPGSSVDSAASSGL